MSAPVVPNVRRPLLAAAALLLGAAAIPGTARAADTYKLDPAHTNVGFTVRHFFSKVPGRFTKFEGTIAYDEKDITLSKVDVSIDTVSIDTSIPDRDKHLRSPDFFDAEKYPKITFTSTRVKPNGNNKIQIEGNLTIRGVTKPVVLDVDSLGAGPDAWGGYRAGFEAHTRINRQDYGVSWNKVLEGGGTMLSDDVDITINIEAIKQVPKPADAKK